MSLYVLPRRSEGRWGFRPASPNEIADAVGAEPTRWCTTHSVSGWSEKACWRGAADVLGGQDNTCVIVEARVWVGR